MAQRVERVGKALKLAPSCAPEEGGAVATVVKPVLCCQPAKPGVRFVTVSMTSTGTPSGTGMSSVNVASNRVAAEPSAMHQGHGLSMSFSTAYTGPV
jgi:hypothetical protein